MKIVKVMNNSLVFVKNDKNDEIIVMGKGIGFMKKADETKKIILELWKISVVNMSKSQTI